MRDEVHARGGATVAVLHSLERWEANLVLNLRLWCEGPAGQAQVWNDYACTFQSPRAGEEMRAFETLMTSLIEYAVRPLVRHAVHCACVGSDECIVLNLVKTAADGHLNDAALIATLIAGPAKAEAIAMLAGQVGEGAKQIKPKETYRRSTDATNVIRLH
ncbi:MAG: hypothetical protein AAGK71_12730 [Pseudomonadota bacterium]